MGYTTIDEAGMSTVLDVVVLVIEVTCISTEVSVVVLLNNIIVLPSSDPFNKSIASAIPPPTVGYR